MYVPPPPRPLPCPEPQARLQSVPQALTARAASGFDDLGISAPIVTWTDLAHHQDSGCLQGWGSENRLSALHVDFSCSNHFSCHTKSC